MNKILEKLMSVLPTVEAGATELIQLASEIKAEAQAAQLWTDSHEAAFQSAVAVVAPPDAERPPAPTPSAVAAIVVAFLLLFGMTANAQTTNLLTTAEGYFTSFNPSYSWTNVSWEFDTGYKQVVGQPAANAINLQYDFANRLEVAISAEFDSIGSPVNSVEPEIGYAVWRYEDTEVDATIGLGYDFNLRAFKADPNLTLKKKLSENTYSFLRIGFPYYAGSAFSRNPEFEIGVGGTF